MDERASIPVSQPCPNPTTSYWQSPPSDLATHRSTPDLPHEADIVIIGSGISGASIAHQLLQRPETKDKKIVMLEARNICSGATGRNGGHTKAASYRHFPSNTRSHGFSQALKIALLEYANIKAMQKFAISNQIDCDLISCNTVDIVYDPTIWAESVAGVQMLQDALYVHGLSDDLAGAAKYTIHGEEVARERFLCKGNAKIYGAIEYEAGSINAYKFTCGMLRLCLASGLQLHANTPVTQLSHTNNTWAVETSRGHLKADTVIVATNGYTASLLHEFQGAIVPLRGQVTAHRPGQNMPQKGLEHTYSFVYKEGYEYMISKQPGSTFPGDIVIGGGLGKAPMAGLEEYGVVDDTTIEPTISEYLRESTKVYFGDSWGEDHEDGRIRKEWTGIMGYSPDGFPLIGRVPDREKLFIAASFQGHGMVLCFLCAEALVDEIVGKSTEATDTWFPSSFRITKERMQQRFRGRLHVKASDLEP